MERSIPFVCMWHLNPKVVHCAWWVLSVILMNLSCFGFRYNKVQALEKGCCTVECILYACERSTYTQNIGQPRHLAWLSLSCFEMKVLVMSSRTSMSSCKLGTRYALSLLSLMYCLTETSSWFFVPDSISRLKIVPSTQIHAHERVAIPCNDPAALQRLASDAGEGCFTSTGLKPL